MRNQLNKLDNQIKKHCERTIKQLEELNNDIIYASGMMQYLLESNNISKINPLRGSQSEASLLA